MQSNSNFSIKDYKAPSTQTEEEFLNDVYSYLKKIDETPFTAARQEVENDPMLSQISFRYDIDYQVRLAKLDDPKKSIRGQHEVGLATVSYDIYRQGSDYGLRDNEGSKHVFSHSIFVGLRKKPDARYIAYIAASNAARLLGANNTYFYEPHDKIARKVRFKRVEGEQRDYNY